MTVTLEQTQRSLARWLEVARRGEEVIITTRDGQPVGKLVGLPDPSPAVPEEEPWEQRREQWLAELEAFRSTMKPPPPGSLTVEQILDDDRGD